MVSGTASMSHARSRSHRVSFAAPSWAGRQTQAVRLASGSLGVPLHYLPPKERASGLGLARIGRSTQSDEVSPVHLLDGDGQAGVEAQATGDGLGAAIV